MKKLLVLSILLVSGCYSVNIEVQPVRQWEGHYLTVQDFYENTKNIQLHDGETIWVLSNDTLKRVIKNVK